MDKTLVMPLPKVVANLIAHPQQYSFEQTVLLLYFYSTQKEHTDIATFIRKKVRFRPQLSLAFAVSDVARVRIEKTAPNNTDQNSTEQHKAVQKSPQSLLYKAHIDGTFLGLYGTSSPLPKFYTENLLNERAQDLSATRDFLDIFNNRFYALHFLFSLYSNPLFRNIYTYDTHPWPMLMSLASFGHKTLHQQLPHENVFLRYASLFVQSQRTASGLRSIIAHACHCPDARVHCNVLRHARIPTEQRLCLGVSATSLGEDATLGTEVPCYEGKIGITLPNLTFEHYHNLRTRPQAHTATSTKKQAKQHILHALISNYCREPLEYTITTSLAAGEVRPVCLGGAQAHIITNNNTTSPHFATLGHDTWLGFGGKDSSSFLPPVSAPLSVC